MLWFQIFKTVKDTKPIHFTEAYPGGSDSKASAYNVGDQSSIPGSGHPLEKEMATHSWKSPWTEEHGTLKSMGLQRVRHDWLYFTEEEIVSQIV